jgi:hypothetical protein
MTNRRAEKLPTLPMGIWVEPRSRKTRTSVIVIVRHVDRDSAPGYHAICAGLAHAGPVTRDAASEAQPQDGASHD